MKISSVFAIAGFCSLGVLAALQADHWLESRRDEAHFVLGSTPTAIPAVFQSGSGPADFRLAARKVLPSVVSVDRFDHPNQFFSDDDSNTVQETGTGSGVILSQDGIIVTNNHVVNGAAEVQVRLANKKSYPAQVLGTDSRFDLAVLKIKTTGLTPIEVGDSSTVEVGQWVIAVGNPLGFDQTLSAGIVSSLGRSLTVQGGNLTDAIQTDAAINPGNSGGALCDADGHLVGINSAIAGMPSGYGQEAGSIGIGFAIPVNRVKNIVSQIVKRGYATSAGLGINFNPRYTGILQFEDARRQMNEIVGAMPPTTGIIVTQVQPGGAAEKAGMKTWDVLLAIDGKTTDAPLALNQILNNRRPGDKVQVKFWTKGETKVTQVALSEVRDQ